MMLRFCNSRRLFFLVVFGLISTQATFGSDQYVIRFDSQLHFANLKLGQNTDSASIDFKCETGCRPLSGSELHLFLSHSAALDESRSFLAVNLNYGVLRSLQLDEKNEKSAEVVVPLPASQLKSANQLLITVEQYPGKAGGDSGVWTAIEARSFIVIRCERHPSRMDLRNLPAPLLDPYSYHPKRLSLLAPQNPGADTLEAAALLVANLSARVAPNPVSIDIVGSVAAARGPLLIVGTPWEQPQLASVQGNAPFVIHERNGASRIAPVTGPQLADGEGAAGLFRVPQEGPDAALAVVGNSPGAVLRAARALCLRGNGAAGNLARFSGDSVPPAHELRLWRGFIPPKSRFTLSDLGYKELPLDSQNGFSAQIALNAPPDVSFLRYGHQVSLVWSLRSPSSRQEGSLYVFLNSTLIGKLDAGKIPPGRSRAKIEIAANLLKASNTLKVSLSGERAGASLPAIVLMPETEFSLPRDYAADLPDLALLHRQLYPFSLAPDLSDTIVLVPNDVDRDTFGLLMEFAAFLGRTVPSDRFDFIVKQRIRLTEDEINSRNLINFQIEPDDRRRQERISVPPGTSYVREALSPGDTTKCILTIAAGSSAALARLSHALFSGGELSKLSGDTAYWSSHDIVCLNKSPKRRMKTTFYLADLEIWLRVNWIALPLILAGASGMLFVAMRLILDRYKRKSPL